MMTVSESSDDEGSERNDDDRVGPLPAHPRHIHAHHPNGAFANASQVSTAAARFSTSTRASVRRLAPAARSGKSRSSARSKVRAPGPPAGDAWR